MPTGIGTAIAIGVVGAVGGVVAGNAMHDQANAIRDAASTQSSEYERAQQLLQKNKDQAITDVEASALKAKGLISDGTEALITKLNQTQEGAIKTLQSYQQLQSQGLDYTESQVIKSLTEGGVLERNALTGATLQAIQTLTGSSPKSFAYATGNNPQALQAINDGSSQPISQVVSDTGTSSPMIAQEDKQNLVKTMAERDSAAAKYLQTGDPADKALADQKQATFDQQSSSFGNALQGLQANGMNPDQALVQFGQLAKEEVNAFSEASQKGLDPYTELGSRSALQTQYLSGVLTPSEKAQYESTYGGVEASPLYQFELAESSKALDMRQKALGKTFSGQGAKEFQTDVVNKLAAQEAQRQLGNAQTNTQIGLGAQNTKSALQNDQGKSLATIDQTTGATLAQLQVQRQQLVASLESTLGTQLASSLSNQYAGISNVQNQTGVNKANSLGTTGNNIATLQSQIGNAQANALANSATNQASIDSALGSQQANILGSQTANQASLIAGGANAAFNAALQSSELDTNAALAPVQYGLAALNSGLKLTGQQQGLKST